MNFCRVTGFASRVWPTSMLMKIEATAQGLTEATFFFKRMVTSNKAAFSFV
jgi:hypothetical protein